MLLLVALVGGTAYAQEMKASMNLLANPDFDFHAFMNHRDGRTEAWTSHNVAFWNTQTWGDITVQRESHVDPAIRPEFSTHNLVSIAPGKSLWQFLTLPEAGLAHGDHVSLFAYGYQSTPGALQARIKLMKLDSEDGTWCPKDYGMDDDRTFPKQSRGGLVVAKSYQTRSDQTGRVELRIEDAGNPGPLPHRPRLPLR